MVEYNEGESAGCRPFKFGEEGVKPVVSSSTGGSCNFSSMIFGGGGGGGGGRWSSGL